VSTRSHHHALAARAFVFFASTAFFLPGAHAQQKKEPTERLVTGTVLNKAGQPFPNAVVYLEDNKTMTIKTYVADDHGDFRFAQLSLSTDYDLWAEVNKVKSKTKHISSFNAKPELDYTITVDQ
jgi:hypothetical protein